MVALCRVLEGLSDFSMYIGSRLSAVFLDLSFVYFRNVHEFLGKALFSQNLGFPKRDYTYTLIKT